MWDEKERKRKVVFCVPTLRRPHQATLDSLEASVPLLDKAGWDHGIVHEIGCVYISVARATLLRKALDGKADVIVFIDHDVSWKPKDLLTLIETEGHVIAGTYRFKKDKEEYMGALADSDDNKPIVRADGCVLADLIPAGFLKLTKQAIDIFVVAIPNYATGHHTDQASTCSIMVLWTGNGIARTMRFLNAGERPGMTFG